MTSHGDAPRVAGPEQVTSTVARVHWFVVSIMQVVMAVSMVLALYERQWLTAVVVLAILIMMDAPRRIGRHFRVQIPAEFEMLALVFVFASLFLGEVRGYYDRFWWWDIALHTTSGLLLGIFGFLLVYVLNQHERVELHMKAHFVALFAFLFAVAVGAIWEIFEFTMDKSLGFDMQKPMLGDGSGLTDTMFDLIVDTLGALIISLLGWWYMRHERQGFMLQWIRKFVESNPRLFKQQNA